MKEIPWISTGREARIIGTGRPALRGKKCTVDSFVKPEKGGYPDVRVSIEGEERVMKPWQLVEAKFKTSHRVEKIEEGLWFFEWQGYENNGNTVIMGKNPEIIVDSGHFHLLGSLLVAMDEEELGVDSAKAVLFTHSHPDHFDSAGLLYQAGLKVGMHPKEREYLFGNGGALFGFFGAEVPEIDIEILLDAGEITVDGLDLRVFLTPGHSPGSVCLYWKDRKAMVVGDVIFPGGAFGRCDFPGGSYNILLDSFKVFDDIDIKYLLSGHGPAINGKSTVQDSINLSRTNLRSVIFSP